MAVRCMGWELGNSTCTGAGGAWVGCRGVKVGNAGGLMGLLAKPCLSSGGDDVFMAFVAFEALFISLAHEAVGNV